MEKGACRQRICDPLPMMRVDHRAPLISRIVTGVILCSAVLAILVILIRAAVRWQTVQDAAPALFPLVAGTIAYRLMSLSVTAEGGDVTVHNTFRTWRLPRSQVRGIDIAKIGGGMSTVRVLTDGRAIPVDILRKRSKAMAALGARRCELAEWAGLDR